MNKKLIIPASLIVLAIVMVAVLSIQKKAEATYISTPSFYDLSVGNNIVAGNNVTAVAFLYSSDRTLKTNILPINNALDKVNKLEGVSFNWKNSGGAELGLIAQDVEKVLPELVVTNPTTGLKSVKYGNIVPVLIQAIKEQQKEIDELKAKIK